VKKSKKEVATQKVEHAAKEKLRKERREEQERNVARKKAMTGATHVDDMDVDEEEEGEREDDGDWDENEEITDGDESDLEEGEGQVSSSDEEEQARPIKKARLKGKR